MSSRRVIEGHIHIPVETVRQSVEMMDRHGIEAAVDISPSTGDAFRRRIEAYRRYPGRLHAFCGIDFKGFGEPGWLAREKEALKRYLDAGAVGIKIWKNLGLRYRDNTGRLIPVDDERLAELFDFAQDMGCLIAFHVGDPKAFFRPLTPENERWEELQLNPDWWFGDRSRFEYDWWQIIRQFERVIERHTRAPILGAHFGCAAEEIGYVADVMRQNPHYIVDMSARIGEIGRHDPQSVNAIFTEFQDRIIFGTDMILVQKWFETEERIEEVYERHWTFFETTERGISHPFRTQGNWTVDAIGLSGEVLQKLYYDNAKRYLIDRMY